MAEMEATICRQAQRIKELEAEMERLREKQKDPKDSKDPKDLKDSIDLKDLKIL